MALFALAILALCLATYLLFSSKWQESFGIDRLYGFLD
jgi:hypothetical protein